MSTAVSTADSRVDGGSPEDAHWRRVEQRRLHGRPKSGTMYRDEASRRSRREHAVIGDRLTASRLESSVRPALPERALALGLALVSVLGTSRLARADGYRSPYRVVTSTPIDELVGDILRGPRGDPRLSASVPYVEWYSAETRRRWGAYGPRMRRMDPPAGHRRRSSRWKRERVLAIAARYLGYGYQHHHLPEWHPPAGWPWKKVARGANGRGIDCSNFTAFVYNLALGVQLDTEIRRQAVQPAAPMGAERLRLSRIDLPRTPAAYARTLRPGDLLYLRGTEDRISHVVFWVGDLGRAPDGVPLVLDSTSSTLRAGQRVIPDGVQLRPFRGTNRYFRRASHALRIIAD
jgi:hypothetical protein